METALAVALAGGWHALSVLSASYIEGMSLLDNVANVVLGRFFLGKLLSLTDNDVDQIRALRSSMDGRTDRAFSMMFGEWDQEVIPVPVDDGDQSIDVMFLQPPGSDRSKPRPLLVWLHGGGMVIGNCKDGTLRGLLQGGLAEDIVIASVEYRLAPEHKFPTPPLDCLAALKHLIQHAAELGLDPTRIVVGGSSAGGNLAAVVAMMARDAGIQLCSSLLMIPMIRFGGVTASYSKFAATAVSPALMNWFWRMYVRTPKDSDDWRCCPHRGDFQGVSPTIVAVASHDVLHDEGVEYADALEEAGVQVTRCVLQGSHLAPALDKGGMAQLAGLVNASLGCTPRRLASL